MGSKRVKAATSVRGRLAKLRAPLANDDLRRIWIAQFLSQAGDWAARIALSILVLERSGSAAWSALVVTASVLPWVGLGQLLSPLGDRFARRNVMVACDLARAAAFAALVIPMPVPVLLSLTFLAAIPTPPFAAARSALLAEVAPAELYGDAVALSQLTNQMTLIAGYLGGGLLVAAIGARGALLLNGASFLASALVLVRLTVGRRPVAAGPGDVGRLRAGARAVWRDPVIRRAVALYTGVSGLAVVPESLVAAFARDDLALGGRGTGLLAAAVPIGTIIAALVAKTEGDDDALLRRAGRLVTVGGALAVIAFVASAGHDTLAIGTALAAFVAVGTTFASTIPTNTVAGRRLPTESRASAFGVCLGVLVGAEAAGAALGGIGAATFGAHGTVIVACALLVAVGLAGSIRWARPARLSGVAPLDADLHVDVHADIEPPLGQPAGEPAGPLDAGDESLARQLGLGAEAGQLGDLPMT